MNTQASTSARPFLTVRLEARDGARSEARLFSPLVDSGAVRAVAICLPAMGVPARYYDRFAASLAARGIACQTIELRGVETSSLRARRGVDFGYRELVEFDLACAVLSVRARFPNLPLYLVGHSLGGQIGVLFSAMFAGEVTGMALIAAATPYYRMFPGRRRALMLGGSVVFPLVSRALGYWPGSLFRFGHRESRRLIAEWGHLGRTGQFRFAGAPANLADALATVEIPVLSVSIDRDPFAPSAAVDHLATMLPRTRCTRIHVGRDELGADVDHFRWARSPEPMATIVADWIVASDDCGFFASGTR